VKRLGRASEITSARTHNWPLCVAVPLYEYAVQKWNLKDKRVSIVCIGGLGHMAIQFAETFAVFHIVSKKSFCEALGATGFIDSSDNKKMAVHAGKFHYLLFSLMLLLFNRLTLSSYLIGSNNQMHAMLKFTAEYNIKPAIGEFTHKTANEAIKKIGEGIIRFRVFLRTTWFEAILSVLVKSEPFVILSNHLQDKFFEMTVFR